MIGTETASLVTRMNDTTRTRVCIRIAILLWLRSQRELYHAHYPRETHA